VIEGEVSDARGVRNDLEAGELEFVSADDAVVLIHRVGGRPFYLGREVA
jgi:hypothetical protein